MPIKSVSQTWFRPTEQLHIKLVVNLLDASMRDSFYSVYENGELDYLVFNSSSSVVFQYSKKGEPWDISKTIHINDSNIVRMNRGLNDMRTILSNPNLFLYHKRDGGIEYNGTEKDKVSIQLGKGEFLEMEPGILFTNTTTDIPGVYLRINKKANEVCISIDEFESIAYKLARVDIGSEGLKLLIAKMLVESQTMKKPIPDERKQDQMVTNIFVGKEPSKEQVIDNRRAKIETPSSLDDL